MQSTWLFALIWAPITAGTTLLGFIPLLGPFAALGLVALQVVMTIYAMAAAHRLTVGKATVVVLIPVAIAVVLTACALGVIMAATLATTPGH